MTGIFSRTEMLLGAEAMKKLAASRVAVFGVGGVGGHAMEALVRSGIGAIDLIDHDTVDETNLNRQIIATGETIGRPKVEVAAERIASINPECRVTIHNMFYLPNAVKEAVGAEAPCSAGAEAPRSAGVEAPCSAGAEDIDFTAYDYVIDAIDTVSGKLGLIEAAKAAGTPIICSMGAGNKLDASAFRVADIYDTSVCPLAKVIRRECRKRGIESLKVVYSEEEPKRPNAAAQSEDSATPDATVISDATVTSESDVPGSRKATPGSVAFAPAVAGLIMAGEVVQDLCIR